MYVFLKKRLYLVALEKPVLYRICTNNFFAKIVSAAIACFVISYNNNNNNNNNSNWQQQQLTTTTTDNNNWQKQLTTTTTTDNSNIKWQQMITTTTTTTITFIDLDSVWNIGTKTLHFYRLFYHRSQYIKFWFWEKALISQYIYEKQSLSLIIQNNIEIENFLVLTNLLLKGNSLRITVAKRQEAMFPLAFVCPHLSEIR